jgi:hypothetical protein
MEESGMTKDQLIESLKGARGAAEVGIEIMETEDCFIKSVEVENDGLSVLIKPGCLLDIVDEDNLTEGKLEILGRRRQFKKDRARRAAQ